MLATLLVCIVMQPGFMPHGVDPGCAPFVDPSYTAVIGVYGDGNPDHWRHFKVRPRERLARSEKCRDRFDARRILLGREPTRWMPRRCETPWERRQHPDAYPAATKGGARIARLPRAPFIAEGDSLMVQMQPFLSDADTYDAYPGRPLRVGVDRLLARHDLQGHALYVSLGTADYLFHTADANAVSVAHEARLLLRRTDCVVWKLIHTERAPWGDTGDGGEAMNRGLRRVTRLQLVEPVRPDAGDGLHFTPEAAAKQATRFREAATRCHG